MRTEYVASVLAGHNYLVVLVLVHVEGLEVEESVLQGLHQNQRHFIRPGALNTMSWWLSVQTVVSDVGLIAQGIGIRKFPLHIIQIPRTIWNVSVIKAKRLSFSAFVIR